MDISEQKSCLMCGTKKSIEAFRSKSGKITAICLQCLEKANDGDQGGGGFQVNIIDKLAAIALEQEQAKTEYIENFEAVTDRLDEQTERLHNQDNQKKYSSNLFNERKTGETSRTTIDNKNSQKQATETIPENSNKESQAEKKTTTTTSTRQNTLFSTSENKQSIHTNQQPITTTSLDSSAKISATDKTNAAATRSSLFAVIPSAETLDKASGKVTQTAQQTTDPKTKSDNKLDDLATRFMENILRGPGRR